MSKFKDIRILENEPEYGADLTREAAVSDLVEALEEKGAKVHYFKYDGAQPWLPRGSYLVMRLSDETEKP